MPTFSKRTILVSRCRNSHDLYIGLQTNFGIKGHWQFIKSPGPNIAMRQLAVMAPASYFREIFHNRPGMILTCPSCGTRYSVDGAKFPSQGRTVRCAKCGHSWHQAPETESEPEAVR